jgi:hypothetical protein
LLLMTPNPAVWRRRSRIRRIPSLLPHANPREWPALVQSRKWRPPSFVIERVTTLDTGGDQGLLCWGENHYVRGGMSLLIGRRRWLELLERAGVGRELVIIARRR